MKPSRRLVVSALLGSVAVLTLARPSHAQTAVDAIFDYTGSNQSFVVPTGVTSLRVRLWGGGGGDIGGGAAFVTGLLSVTPGESLTLIVAGAGLDFHNFGGFAPGGFGGGGMSGASTAGGSGGGRSAIRNSSGTELVTAAGGGGGLTFTSNRGGYGGLAVGGPATDFNGDSNAAQNGQGGTQTEGGAVGGYGGGGSAFLGGSGAPIAGSGGGGGYFGGGAGLGGGGGSSFLDNLTDAGASERGGGSSVFFDYMISQGADPQYLLDNPNNWYYMPGGYFDPFGGGYGFGGASGTNGAPGRIVLSYTLSASASAPEPGTAALLALGVLTGARVRRALPRRR